MKITKTGKTKTPMSINYDTLANRFITTNSRYSKYSRKLIRWDVTLKGFKDYFLVTRDCEKLYTDSMESILSRDQHLDLFYEGIDLPYYHWHWDGKLKVTLINQNKLCEFDTLFCRYWVTGLNYRYGKLLEEHGLFLDNFNTEELIESYKLNCPTYDSKAQRPTTPKYKEIAPIYILEWMHSETVTKIKAQLTKERNEFKSKYFNEILLLDLTDRELTLNCREDKLPCDITDKMIRRILERVKVSS